MSNETTINDVLSPSLTEAAPNGCADDLSLESLALLINTDRLKFLEDKIKLQFIELKKRQDQVTFLHKLIKTVNAATDNSTFDCSNNPELQDLLTQAKEHGVDIKDGKFSYNSDERERLIDNIRITADDYNVLNDMQLQTITRLTNERYESYQLARSIMKPLHDDKTNKARAMAGR